MTVNTSLLIHNSVDMNLRNQLFPWGCEGGKHWTHTKKQYKYLVFKLYLPIDNLSLVSKTPSEFCVMQKKSDL